jgi:hypothetical protein
MLPSTSGPRAPRSRRPAEATPERRLPAIRRGRRRRSTRRATGFERTALLARAPRRDWRLALLPFVATLAGGAVGLVVGFECAVPGSSPLGVLPTYTLLVPCSLLGVAGPVYLLNRYRTLGRPD